MDPMESQVPQSGVKVWQWVVTVIVIIALIVIGILVFGSKKSSTTLPEENTPNTTTTTGTNSIIMSDQFPGNVVYISSVQSTSPVWVTIAEDNDGMPGNIIGKARFEAGINPGKITLTKSTVDGQSYYAIMNSDDGDNTFDATKDVPLKDAKGNVIMKIFRATSTANIQIKG